MKLLITRALITARLYCVRPGISPLPNMAAKKEWR
jgi:hypothetical protein